MADKFAVTDIKSALARKLFPTITLWNRLEGRPRTANFERALRAEARDALWKLARQKQVGEFRGEDAGSPVFAKARLATTRLTRFKPGDAAAMDFDETIPLEVQVERRPLQFTLGQDRIALDLRLLMGRRWLKLIAGIGNYAKLFINKYGFTEPDPARRDDAAVCAHPEVWQSFAAAAGRAMDGAALYFYLRGAPGRHAYDGIPILDAHKARLDAAAKTFADWVPRLIEQPQSGENAAWRPARLEYRFACAAPTHTGEKKLVADEYYQGTLDWHAVDVDPAAASLGENTSSADPRTAITRTMLPVPIGYPGMPHPRWWTFEDSKTNFGEIKPDTTDLAKLLFVEFGLVYSNDWFIVPFTLGAGSVVAVEGLAVTNVFGERIWIKAAGRGADDTWQRWSMYTVTIKGNSDRAQADTSLLVLPTVPKVQEGAPLEEIMFIRDEMANMVWAIEKTIPAADGRGKPGSEAARETRAYFERLLASSGVSSPPTVEPRAKIRYEVMNSVPEHWIPFIPVRAKGSNREIDLQRAAMPRVLEGDPLSPVKVRPRTSLLRAGLDQANPQPYLVPEEEVPRAGVRVTQAFQRTRWYDGRVFVWVGVRKQTGRGEGSSGLRFDIVEPTSKPSSP